MSLSPNMHTLATVSYTVSQCGRKVCFITSLYSQVTRPCFLKEKKSLCIKLNWRRWWTRILGGFLFAPHQSFSFIITTNPILFIKREKKRKKNQYWKTWLICNQCILDFFTNYRVLSERIMLWKKPIPYK